MVDGKRRKAIHKPSTINHQPGIDKSHLEKAVKDAYNRAIKHSHDIAAQKMKDVTGLNLPGIT